MVASRIKLGIYGASGSGKTSFFRQLVKGNGLPVAPGSKLAQFMNATIDPDGRIVPTTAQFDHMEIKIDRTTFELGDWQGDVLSEADDLLDMERRRGWSGNLVARQVLRSDAFFFFFDPSGETGPGKLPKHHNKELLRAKQLIDYMLESRQNRLLPLLFILGHQDRVQKDPELTRLTEKWIEEVDDYIEESYSQNLMGYYPRSLVRKEQIFHRVSTTVAQHDEDLLDVMEKARFLVELADQFRRRDRKRSIRLVIGFFLCTLLVLLIPLICLTSPAAQKFLLQVRTQAAPVLENIPSFSNSIVGQAQPVTDIDHALSILQNDKEEIDTRTASSLNLSLFQLMKVLNQLEDAKQVDSEEYAVRLSKWNHAFEAIEKRFDRFEPGLSDRDKLSRFGSLLMLLTDSPDRECAALESVLQKYWQLYRNILISEIQSDLTVYIGANIPSQQILREIRNHLDKAYQEVSESKVRGISLRKTIPDSLENNRKDSLLRDIKKAYLACGYYSESYPVNIKIQSASYHSDKEIDRDYSYRLLFYGGKERKEEFIDLTISSGFENNRDCTFLPSRKDFTVYFVLDHPLRVAVQKKHKGSSGEWERVTAWEISSEELQDPSLNKLGLNFYLRYENEENTSYVPENLGFKFDFLIRRPRNVPELLWEIVFENGEK